MRSLSDFPCVYLHRDVVDFRQSINGLSVIVEHAMQLSPYEDALFVFCNRRRDKLKLLYWDRTGFCLWYKRLEQDQFKWPRKSEWEVVNITVEQMDWLLRGYDISRMQSHSSLKYNAVS